MENVAWALIGTALGGLLAILGNVIAVHMQLRADERKSQSKSFDVLRKEKKDTYLRLLAVCRRLRYLSRPGRERPLARVDELRTELSSITYEIDLIAPPEVAHASQRLAMATREYLSLSLARDAETAGDQRESLETHKSKARLLVDEFIVAARADLDASQITR